VEEERIKSAFEIAMERISALPELTAEDIAAQKEKQFGPIGEGLAAKYLGGLIDEEALPIQVEKLPEDQRPIVRRALITALCRTLQLEGDPGSAEKALRGLQRAFPGKVAAIESEAEKYREITREFREELQRQSAAIEAVALKPLGISGTAVRCNPGENPHWLGELKKLRQTYEPRLAALRSNLLQELQKF